MTDWSQTLNTEENSEQILKSIKSDYQKIKTIIEKIKWYYSNFEQFTNNINQQKDELEANHNISNEFKSKIEEFKNTSERDIQTIKEFLDQANLNTKELKEIIKNAKELNKSFDETKSLIWQKLDESTQILKDISSLKQTSDNKVVEIQQNLDSIKEKITNIENFYKIFEELSEKISNEESWAQALLDYITEQKKESETILKDLWDMRLKANKIVWEIEQEKEQSINMRTEVWNILQKSKEDKESISKYVTIITNSGFANAFGKKEKSFWIRAIVRSSLLFILTIWLLWLLIWLFKDYIQWTKEIEELKSTLLRYRISFTTPLIFLIAFVWKEYASAKKNHERYWFKAAISQAFPTQVQDLIDKFEKFENWEEIILETVKNVYSTVYKTPYTEDWISKFEDKLMEKTKSNILKETSNEKNNNILSIIENIKALKDTIPDQKELIELIKIIMNYKQ